MATMTGRELAKEIQSVDKGFKAPWMSRMAYEEMMYGVGKTKEDFDKYCDEMTGEVVVKRIEDL
ncbi:hypothetical protein LLR47_19645 [Bacillus cereus]|uniref:hypothetical protein n=1 Tax=Bacillus cereus TaxID=1396 RepID=UPI001D14C651|nr:hypothetical protein [Bacillus cereus]MCC3687419.1 hypothetical protein [Bacillus cereus]